MCVCVCVCLCVQLSYSPHQWTDHDQTWHDDGPPPRDGTHNFSRSRSKVKVIAYVYILSYSPHHWTDHDQTWHDDGPPPRDGAHNFSRSRSKVKVIAYVYILSYSPHHWTDHDQTWHDDGPPPRDGAHHFSRSRSKVKVIFGAALHKLPHLGMVHAKLGFATILGAALSNSCSYNIHLLQGYPRSGYPSAQQSTARSAGNFASVYI